MKNIYRCLAVFLLLTLTIANAAETLTAAKPITATEVQQAQLEWGNAIVAIGKAYTDKQDYKALAAQLVKKLYNYPSGPVLFKPTKAAAVPFRPKFDQALSYFVGGVVPEDHGFALAPWSKVRFADVQTIPGKDIAISMGHYYFTDAKTGKETKVEFTFAYTRSPEGELKIIAHHSSLPYQPQK